MTDSRKWLITLLIPIAVTLGGSYWMNVVSQVETAGEVRALEGRLSSVEENVTKGHDRITANTIMITEINQGWKAVAKAVDTNTVVLGRFTEVLIRLEERDKLKNDREEKGHR